MKKIIVSFISFFTLMLTFTFPVSAHCPLCTVGIVGGLTLTRLLGIDDIYSGLWLGALVGSLSFWFGKSLKKKYFPNQEYIIFGLLFFLTILPFLYMLPSPKLFGGSRLFTGLILGGTIFLLSGVVDKGLRLLNNGNKVFSYQGVTTTIGSLIITALSLFLLKV